MPLTDVKLRGLPLGVPARISDGDGMAIVVPSKGKPWWRFDYRWHGKQRTMSFGTYSDMTLARARERRLEVRRWIEAGRDPSHERRQEKRRATQAHEATLEAVATEWFTQQQDTRSASTMARNQTVMQVHVYPALGRRPIAAIEPPELLDALRAIERRGHHETAHRTKQLCGQIFRYAIATGRATRDPSADLRGSLKPVKTTHYAAVTQPAAVGKLLRAIEAFDGSPVVKIALQLAALLFVRPGELRTAEWTEIDLASAIWRIPAEKMKMRAVHLVPLSRQACNLFRAAQPYGRGSRFVFPCRGTIQRPMSDVTLGAVLGRMGYASDEMTPHGFRAMARTLLDERLRCRSELIELQLAHAMPGALAATYNRSQYLEERTAMMQAYADYLDTLKKTIT